MRYTKYILASVIILSVMIFLNIIEKIYTVTLNDAKINHQKQQLEMVKIVSEGLVYFIDHLVKGIKMIESLNSRRFDQAKNLRAVWEYYTNYYDSSIALSLIQLNKEKHQLTVSGASTNNKIVQIFHKTVNIINNSDSLDSYALSDVFFLKRKSQTYKSILVVIKIFPKSVDDELVFIGCLVDFEKLIKNFIKPLKLSSNDFIWMLDKNGRLIFHPRHEEMIFKSVMSSEQKCMKCHTSFDVQREIVK